MLVTTLILGAALSTMIVLATGYFRDQSESLIQEYNLSLARLIGERVEGDLSELASDARVLASLLDEPALSSDRLSRYATGFFEENENCLMLAVAAPKSVGKLMNLRHLLQNRQANDALQEGAVALLSANVDRFRASFAGATLVRGLQNEAGLPLIALSLPLSDTNGIGGQGAGEILIALVQAAPLLEAFRESGQTALFDVFLIDEEARLIAANNPESQLYRLANGDATANAQPDLSAIPIVTALRQNGSASGSQQFAHQQTEYLGSYRQLDFGRLSVVSTMETERAFEAVYLIRERNLKIMAIVLLFAFLFVFFFSRTLSRPISRLVEATRQIEQGNYEIGASVPTDSHDEVGQLSASFAHMAQGLAEKEKIKRTFGKFVNPEIVNRALNGELKLGGENKVSAVLFSDLRNFTAMSENLRPNEVVALLNDYFTHMVDCVHQRYGVVDKFIGDALMAHWGAILSNGNDTENAVQAAIDMRRALVHVNDRLGLHGANRLQIGCGINTGPVLAGQIGSETRLEYTVIGDTVNLASRIEYLNKHFGTDILISEYSYRMVEGMFRVVEMPPIRIKGKSRAETVYAVLGRLDDPRCPQTIADLRADLGISHDAERMRRNIEASSDQLVNEENLYASPARKRMNGGSQ